MDRETLVVETARWSTGGSGGGGGKGVAGRVLEGVAPRKKEENQELALEGLTGWTALGGGGRSVPDEYTQRMTSA